ncbi:DUF502 domain-containing protein [uncultured Paracoccus sp.]|uniref:DUF502 domain-containing protein n=1 Tax=uncultured Paracoccus sp. TaxID=189685 RepID=UPI0026392F81|nr:DUF502 domain-containing protein [uncultured Paracoccus sp.]
MRTSDDIPPLSPRRRPRGPRRTQLGTLRASFLTGLAVMLPIALTVWLFWSLTGWMDSWVLPMVPMRWHPETWLGVNPRGVGVIIFLLFTVIVGWIAKGFIGRSLIRSGERLLDRVPIVRSVYGGLKQISETLLSQGDEKFDNACLVEYPRKGVWGVGFVAGPAKGEIAALGTPDNRIMAVFVPTTPNPTSGFLLYVPELDLTYLEMGVEDAAKLIISGGLVYPSSAPADPP